MPGKAMFGRDMLFNLTSTIYLRVVSTRKQRKVGTDNVCDNSRLVRYDYSVFNLVYAENTCI